MTVDTRTARLLDPLTRFMRWLEDLPISLPGVLAFYIVIAFIRSYFETTLLHPGIFLVIWFFWNAYFCFCFISASYIASIAAQRPSLKTLRASMAIVWLVIIPPLFDYYLVGRRLPYDYLFSQQIFKAVVEFFTAGTVSVGMRLEVSLYVLAVTVYVGLMARSWTRAIISGIIFFFVGIVLVAQYPGLWVPLANYAAPMLPDRPYQPSFLLLLYLVLAIAFLAIVMRRQDKDWAARIVRAVTAPPLGMVLLACLTGLVFARQTIILALTGPVYAALSLITVTFCLAAVRWAGVGDGRGKPLVLWDWAALAAVLALALGYLISGIYGVIVVAVWLFVAAAAKILTSGKPAGIYGQAALTSIWVLLAFLFGAVATRYQLLPEHLFEIGRAAAVVAIVAVGACLGPALVDAGKTKRRRQEAGLLVWFTFLSPLFFSQAKPVLFFAIGGASLAALTIWHGRWPRLVQPLGLMVALVAFIFGSGLLATPIVL